MRSVSSPAHTGGAADAAALQALLWNDIANRISLHAVGVASVESTEKQARAELWLQRCTYLAALCTSLAERATDCARRDASRAAAACQSAIGWAKLGDLCARPAVERAASAEQQHREEEQSKTIAVAEQTLARLRDDTSIVQRELHGLQEERDAVRASVRDAEEQRASIEAMLETTKATQEQRLREAQAEAEAKIAQRTQEVAVVEARLDEVRVALNNEETQVQIAKQELASVQQQQQQVQQQVQVQAEAAAAAEANGPRLAPPAAGTAAGGSRYGSFREASGSFSRGGHPVHQQHSMETGLAALQNVREQLWDLRRQQSSVGTPPHSPTAAMPTTGGGTTALSRANTVASLAGTVGNGGPATAVAGAGGHRSGASLLSGGQSAEQPGSPTASSPWKQRLVRLQGDLRALRTELVPADGGGAPAATAQTNVVDAMEAPAPPTA